MKKLMMKKLKGGPIPAREEEAFIRAYGHHVHLQGWNIRQHLPNGKEETLAALAWARARGLHEGYLVGYQAGVDDTELDGGEKNLARPTRHPEETKTTHKLRALAGKKCGQMVVNQLFHPATSVRILRGRVDGQVDVDAAAAVEIFVVGENELGIWEGLEEKEAEDAT